MSQSEAKKRIAELVAKYKKLSPTEIKSYSEEDTKNSFIKPLFQALGWDFGNRQEVSAEEHIKSSGFIDYGFYLNSRAKFYLEAKKLSSDVHKVEYADQAIRYAFNRVVTWAVLTDFESLKVFNAQAISKYLGDKLVFEIPYSQFLERFDQLWLLSRESFEKDLIDKWAEEIGKKLQKVSVTDTLFKDLNKCREILTRALHQWNPKVSREDLDEGIQKLLDRLIFLRVAEDRKIEEPVLRQLIRDWKTRKENKSTIYQSMTVKFREFDDIYNSNLFDEHPFEKWEEHDDKTEEVIEILYGKPGYYDYDFKYIPADTLGTVYENYLGYQLAQSEKSVNVSQNARKRKEQGIYYTPTYIVDYIVTNALKPVLDKCESVQELKNVKVLDPACGSGSFLIRAGDMIFQKYKELNSPGADFLIKDMILRENIFGVDLDEKAVEIARLNLLINALDSRVKLPPLDKNIKNGNSLISGTDVELEKAFGKNFRDKKPFNWAEEFPQIFKRSNPGFDVIIGNPPYVGSLELSSSGLRNDKDYFKNNFGSAIGNFDLYILFIEQSLGLLRSSGQFSFIVPNKFLVNDYGLNIRKMVLSKELTKLTDFSHLPVFHGAAVYPIVLVINNSESKDNSNTLLGISNERFEISYKRKAQKDWLKTQNSIMSLDDNSEANPILQKIELVSEKLGDVAKVSSGTTGFDYQNYGRLISDTKKPKSVKFVITRNIHPYTVNWGTKIHYLKSSFSAPYLELDDSVVTKGRQDLYKNPDKILIRGMAKKLIAGIDQEGFALGVGTYAITDSEIDNFLLLGLLNSKILNFYYRTKFKSKHLAGGYLAFNAGQLKQIPIHKSGKNEGGLPAEIKSLSTKMFNLSQELKDQTENSTKWHTLKSEIERTDHQIDQLVYKLYNLTPEEIRIIEARSD